MNSGTRWWIAIAMSLVAIQLVRFPRTNPAVESDLGAPAQVQTVLRRACYDCHSNMTAWPWYSAVAPASWIIHRDVNEGRKRLNFSSWADYTGDPGTWSQKLSEIEKAVASGDMAPWYYQALHPDARLSESERGVVTHWATDEKRSVPTDSVHGEERR